MKIWFPVRRAHGLFALLLILIAALQWPGLPGFLDGILGGIEWSSGIVAFLKENTQGLILLLLIGLFFEFRDRKSSSYIEQAAAESQTVSYGLLKNAISASEGSALTEIGLSKLYGVDAARQMTQNLFVDLEVLKNLDLYIKINESDEDFHIDIELSYETNYDKFLVAVSRDTALIEKLLSSGEVNEAFYSNSRDLEIPATIKRIADGDGLDPKGVELMKMKVSSSRRKQKIASRTNLPKSSVEDFELYEEISPAFKTLTRRRARFVISYQIKQSKNCTYTYWMNDRISLIREIKIDISAVSEQYRESIKLHRFMASSRWKAEVQFHNEVCVMPLDLWSVPGDGLVITWFDDLEDKRGENNEIH
ncbi:MAG: hypothetical protein ACE37E_00425 [Hyphomicrobiales bacterium]